MGIKRISSKKSSPIPTQKVLWFEQNILVFYRKEGRKDLPWRKKNATPYEVWVSEIMLQQTQVSRSVEFYTRFLKRFPVVFALARASWRTVLPYWRGLGYYGRGRNMLAAAKIVARDYGGKFPVAKSGLMKLPGVGEYTASAILSFAHGGNHLSWDTNFQRVFGRFFYGSKNALCDKEIFEKRIKANKRDFNGAIMDFGSLVCVRTPKCEICPLSKQCVFFHEKGRQEEVLSQKKKILPKNTRAVVILHEGHKKYYSVDKKYFTPFVLGAGRYSRADIKRHFKEKYGLELSVRPPHSTGIYLGAPALFVRAQILLGKPKFAIFTEKPKKYS